MKKQELKIEALIVSKDQWTKRNDIAIHLLEPSNNELLNAFLAAEKDMFSLIIIYTNEKKRYTNIGNSAWEFLRDNLGDVRFGEVGFSHGRSIGDGFVWYPNELPDYDTSIEDYLEQYRTEEFSSYNLMLDNGLLASCADFLVGAGIEDKELINWVEDNVTPELLKHENKEFWLLGFEVWINPKTDEHQFIPQGFQDYFITQADLEGYEFDCGYEVGTGKKYHSTRLSA